MLKICDMNLYKVISSKEGATAVRIDYVNATDYDHAAIKVGTLYPHPRVIKKIVEVET